MLLCQLLGLVVTFKGGPLLLLLLYGEEVADFTLAFIIDTNTYLIADLVRGRARGERLNDFRTKHVNQDGTLGAKQVRQIGADGVQGTE